MRGDNYTLLFIRNIKVVINGRLLKTGGGGRSLRQTGDAGHPIFVKYDNLNFSYVGHPDTLPPSPPRNNVVRTWDQRRRRASRNIFVPHTSHQRIFSNSENYFMPENHYLF